MKKSFLLQSFILFIVGSAFAQDYRFTATVSSAKVRVGNQFELVYTFEGGAPQEFNQPDLRNFKQLGPVGQGQSTQIINTAVTRSYTFTYRLSAVKEGTFTIQPASIKSNNLVFESNAVKVEVLAGGSKQNDINSQIEEKLFIKTIVNKTKVYMGEQIFVTYKMFKNTDIQGFNPKSNPTYEGFWKEVVSAPDKFQLKNELVDGVRYQTGTIESVILFPQKTGKITLEPHIINVSVPVRTRGRGGDPFFDNFFGNYELYEFELKSPTQTIEVLPLPTNGKPVDFSGMVGELKFTATLSSNEVEANDAVTLNVTVSGTGNLKLLKPWDLQLPSDIELYDPKTEDHFSVSSGVFKGSRKFEYLLYPRREGTYKLPEISFSYFDTKTEKYVTYQSGELNLKVGKGQPQPNNQSQVPITNFSSEGIDVINTDIRFISEKTSLTNGSVQFFGTWPHLLLAGSPLALLLLAIGYRKKRNTETADIAGTKRKKATGIALKRLKLAKTHLDKKEVDLFYNEISKAVYGYFIDKFNIPLGEMSKEKAIETLVNQKIEARLQEQLSQLIDACEYARFAPSAVIGETNKHYEIALDLITSIEQQVK